MTTFNDSFFKNNFNDFPFDQIESCTANKQEHVLSAVINLVFKITLLFRHTRFRFAQKCPNFVDNNDIRLVKF